MNTDDEHTAFPFENETQRFLRERLQAAKSDSRQPRQNAEPQSSQIDKYSVRREKSTTAASATSLLSPPASPSRDNRNLLNKPFIAAMVAVMVAAAFGASAGFYFATQSTGLASSRAQAKAAPLPVERSPEAAAASTTDVMANRIAVVREIAAEDTDDHATKRGAARGENKRPAAATRNVTASKASPPQRAATCSPASVALALCE